MQTSSFTSRRRALSLPSVLALGAGLGLAACGGTATQAPAAAVDSSVSQLGASSSLNVSVSLGITSAQAQELSKKSGSSMTKAEADALSSGSVFFATQTGKGEALDSQQALTDSANAYDFGLQFGTQKPFEIRYLSQNLYVRADLDQLLADVGQDPSKAANVKKTLAQINTAVPGISDLGTTKWVELSSSSLKTVSSLLKTLEASQSGAQPNTSQIQSAMVKLPADAISALKANSTYTSLGTKDGRSEYALTVNVHGFLARFGPELQSDLKSIPVIGSKVDTNLTKLQDKVPANQTAIADLYTSGGKLSEVSVDVNQFAGKDKVSFAVPLEAKFTGPPAISVPTGATNLDLSKLPQLLQQIAGGVAQHGSGGGTGA